MADEIRSAGALVWRPGDGAAMVLVVHRPKYDDWSFAKGKLEAGEHVLLAAVREVAEETGLAVTLGRRLRPVRYLAGGRQKRVDYWAATPTDGADEFVPGTEVDEVAWLPAGSPAPARLSYQQDADVLAELGRDPQPTVPLIVLRHASAGSRTDWGPGDGSRSLDTEGEHDARALASLLRCFGVSRVVSAPAERCVGTVRPYAAATGAAVAIEPAFDVPHDHAGQPAVRPADAAKAAAALAAAPEPVIICAHRENLPVIVEAACAELDAGPPPGRPLRKGEFWVLHRAGRTLAAAERYHPAGDG